MKYLRKLSFVFLALTLFLGACEDDEQLTIITPEAAFTLQQPGISNVFLNFSLPNNSAFTLGWNDDVTGSSSYTVEMSLDADFTAPVALGTSSTKSFSISVQDLNDAIRNAGATNFRDVAVYVRVSTGSENSNSVLFLVTTYPNDPPTITGPANADSFVLSIATADDVVMTVNWTDAILASTLGADVEYTVEAATAGTSFASPAPVGVVTNVETLSATHAELNDIALGLGLAVDTAADVDMRIIARYDNANGDTLERVSETVTVSITPYNAVFPNIYFVGDATTPGWNNNNNNTVVFRSQDTPNSYNFTGYFASGAFKLLEERGQWQPQWGTNDGTTLAVNDGTGSDPGTFNVGAAGYYTYTFSPLSAGATFTVTSFDASSSPTYARIGLIGQAIGGWGDGDEIDLTQDPNNPHLWNANGVNFTNGDEFLIRPNDDWNNGLWRYTGSQELFGQSDFSTGGNNFVFNGDTGAYDVWFNDLDGSYVFIAN